MNKKLFMKKYKKFNLSNQEMEKCIKTIEDFENFAEKEMEDITIDDIKSYISYLISINKNKYNNVIHFTRYLYYINHKEEYIHMTKYFNAVGVLENIVDRISIYDSQDTQEKVMSQISLPPFGIDSGNLPTYTKDFMDKLKEFLPQSKCNKILAGNNHRIPISSVEKEKEYYQNCSSLEQYLKERHQRKVEELQYHLDNNIVWFEQIITQEAIDYVKNNQEILSGVIENDKLYITKIPYDINRFLTEKDDTKKRYYACHCSFVRENILSKKEDIPKEWCYCSAGFAKFPFEIILGAELDVTLLKTPINGDYTCRFEIDLSNIEYKR